MLFAGTQWLNFFLFPMIKNLNQDLSEGQNNPESKMYKNLGISVKQKLKQVYRHFPNLVCRGEIFHLCYYI
jgi:hypothetical protein